MLNFRKKLFVNEETMDVEDIRGKYMTSGGDETLIIDYRLRTNTAYDISGRIPL